ncbi:MAG: hypothetical protein MMC33_005493 [Icmadophila ericetorum]|nr:hypothetical protein [Icmadophila ericetorum]
MVRLSLALLSVILSSLSVDALPLSLQTSLAIVEIEQTLNRFSRSVDTHDYSILDTVFTDDAIANFADGTELYNLTTIKSALQAGLVGMISQHALSTQQVEVNSALQQASTVSYLQGTFFGQGNLTGQIYTTYGQ